MSRSSSKLGQVGSKIRLLGQILEKNLVYILEGTGIIRSSGNFVRMLILIICRSSSKLGHVRSKTRSLGQILTKPCVHSKVHSFVSNVMKLCQNVVNHHNIQVKFETGSCWVKNVMLGQISFVT